MSNKRIDLTQFEGITPTQWRVDYEAVGDIKTVLYVKSDMTAHGNFVITVLEDAPNGEYTEADANAIAAVPNLIAELKRCYKRIDLLTKAFMMAGNDGCYLTICKECDDVHRFDDVCPFICMYCNEKDCECQASE